jgi:hypothetical protein
MSANASSCGGCTITAGPVTFTYPSPVSEVTSSVTVTVVPFIYQYPNGTEVTVNSTYQQYTAGATGQSIVTSPAYTPLTWTTLGTVLTYPTTYLGFVSPLAGVSKEAAGADSFCYASLTTVGLGPSDYPHLIFPFNVPEDRAVIIASASVYLDTVPSMTAAVFPYAPSACSHLIGTGTSQAPEKTSTAATENPMIHTSVSVLVQVGKPVITRVPAESQIAGAGTTSGYPPASTPTSNGSGGKTTAPPAGGTAKVSPVLGVGGSTITPDASGVYNVGGQTITPGGSAVVVDGTTISIASGGSVAVVNGQTSTLASTTFSAPESTGAAAKLWASGVALGAVGIVGLLL